jgi:hypothetical protein
VALMVETLASWINICQILCNFQKLSRINIRCGSEKFFFSGVKHFLKFLLTLAMFVKAHDKPGQRHQNIAFGHHHCNSCQLISVLIQQIELFTFLARAFFLFLISYQRCTVLDLSAPDQSFFSSSSLNHTRSLQ